MEHRIDKQGLLDALARLERLSKTEIDIGRLIRRFKETASYDVLEDKVNNNLEHFMGLLKKGGF